MFSLAKSATTANRSNIMIINNPITMALASRALNWLSSCLILYPRLVIPNERVSYFPFARAGGLLDQIGSSVRQLDDILQIHVGPRALAKRAAVCQRQNNKRARIRTRDPRDSRHNSHMNPHAIHCSLQFGCCILAEPREWNKQTTSRSNISIYIDRCRRASGLWKIDQKMGAPGVAIGMLIPIPSRRERMLLLQVRLRLPIPLGLLLLTLAASVRLVSLTELILIYI